MEIELFDFSKRENSTKQPTGSGSKKTVVLKDSTSTFNPSFILEGDNLPYNYVKAFGNYYYITNNTKVRKGVSQIDCSLDVLATFKTNILNTTAFVAYSSNLVDTTIPDNRLSTGKDVIINSTTSKLPFEVNGRHVISYIGSNGADYVSVDIFGLRSLVEKIQDNEFAEIFNDPTNALSKVLTNTSACITSCTYNPCTVKGTEKEIVLVGGYKPGITGFNVPRSTDFDISISIPWNFTDFRQRSQYTSLLIYLPGYGIQPLNADNYTGKSTVNIHGNIDSVVGEITYIIDNITRCTATVGSSEQISTTTNGRGGVISATSTVLESIVSGNINPSEVFKSVISNLQTNPGSVGGASGETSFNAKKDISVYCISHNTSVDPSSVGSAIGRPYNRVVALSSCSGYTETVNASVSADTSIEVLNSINNYLNGGVFIE